MGWKQILKSWTLNANALLGSLVTIGSILGYDIDARLVAEVFTFLNILLRFKTDRPVQDK